jgi:hypothetical protein
MSQVWRGIMTEAFGKSHASRSQASLLRADLRRGTVDDWQYFFPNQSESERMFRVWGEGGTPSTCTFVELFHAATGVADTPGVGVAVRAWPMR